MWSSIDSIKTSFTIHDQVGNSINCIKFLSNNTLLCPYYNAFKLLSKGHTLFWFHLIDSLKMNQFVFSEKGLCISACRPQGLDWTSFFQFYCSEYAICLGLKFYLFSNYLRLRAPHQNRRLYCIGGE